MYPAPIRDYVAPTGLGACLAALHEHGEEAKIVAGGQSLMPLLKLRLVTPAVLVDVNRLTELSGVEEVVGPDGRRTLRIGSLTRHRVLAAHPLILARYPAVADAARRIGDVQVRNRGTIGGSLAHADPAADLPVPLLALDAAVVAASAGGERRATLDAFLRGPLVTDLAPEELLTAVEVPAPAPGEGSAYTKVSAVYGDFAIVSVAARLRVVDGVVSDVAIAAGGLAGRPQRLAAAEAELRGTLADAAHLRRAAAAAAEEAPVADDARASAGYRRHLLATYTERILAQALQRLQEV